MKKQFAKAMALSLALVLLCSACGLGAANATPTPAATDAGSGTPTATPAAEGTIGLEKNVYSIPDYTNSSAKVIRVSCSLTEADYGITPPGVLFKTFVDRVEELSGGKIVVQIYPGNQLASSTDDIMNGLTSGAFEMAEISVASWGDYTTTFAPMNVPFLFQDNAVAHEILSGEFGDIMSEQLYNDTTMHLAGYMYLGMRTLTNNQKEIHTPADLAGLKVRVQSDPIQVATFDALGASVVSVSFSELFTALQQKLCDGQDNPVHTTISKKFYEVQPYMTLLNHVPSVSAFIMSDLSWNNLSEEEQGWITQAGQEASEASFEACESQIDLLEQQLVDYGGVTVTKLTAEERAQFVSKMDGVWKTCEDTMGTERWNQLQDAVKAAEAKLGLN